MNNPNPRPKKIFATFSLVLMGTASIYCLDPDPRWQHHIESRCSLEFEKGNSKAHIDIRTPKEHLENIRSTLNPPISDLASLLDVSRQSIYKWLAAHSNPEFEKLENIKALSRIADAFKQEGIKRAEILLKMKNAEGLSLFELFKSKQPYEEQLKILITEAKTLETAREQIRMADSKAPSTDDWRSSISIPAFNEDS